MLRRTRPDVVLCDIRMPVRDGLGLLQDVTADPDLGDLRVVMLTTFELDDYVFEALRYGASGFLLKDADPAASWTRSGSSPTAAHCSHRRSPAP